jgi:hypothetical protein
MIALTRKRARANGANLRHVTRGKAPAMLCMYGSPQNHSEFPAVMETLALNYAFIAPASRSIADGCELRTVARDMLDLQPVEGADKYHILSHDPCSPLLAALGLLAPGRALSLATTETPSFGFPGYVDARVAYWDHLERSLRQQRLP